MTLHQDKSYHISAPQRSERQATNCLFYKSTFHWKIFILTLSSLHKICVHNYIKRKAQRFPCNSFHSLIFHRFKTCSDSVVHQCGSAKQNQTPWKTLDYYETISLRKKCESHSEHTQGLMGYKDNQRIFLIVSNDVTLASWRHIS